MKKFIVAAAVTVAISFGFSSPASAQIVYGYSPAAGGVVQSGTVSGPFGYQSYNTVYSPWTGATVGNVTTANVFGQAYTRSFGYNPYTRLGYRTGYYQPNFYVNPFGGYNYGFYRRW